MHLLVPKGGDLKALLDDLFSSLEQKGVNLIKKPSKASRGGYSGYIEDPDGNLWEIAYNPFLKLDVKGNTTGE